MAGAGPEVDTHALSAMAARAASTGGTLIGPHHLTAAAACARAYWRPEGGCHLRTVDIPGDRGRGRDTDGV